MTAAHVLGLCVYPRTFWRLSRWLAERLQPSASRRTHFALHALIFAFLGMPLTCVVSAELIVRGNTLLMGSHSDARLRSDFDTGFKGPLQLPGATRSESGTPPSILEEARADDVHAWLVRRHAPVLVQRVGDHPRWDIPVHIDFDGNDDPRDNVRSAKHMKELRPGIYGEVTAETENEYYLSYSIYHIRDYDHPVRVLASAKAEHDNDNEGVMMRVTKPELQVSEVMTWYHNRFFHCALNPDSHGSERVMARTHFENQSHPILFVQAMGHGVRCAQSVDLQKKDGLKIFRYRGEAEPTSPRLDTSNEFNLRYDIASLDSWYDQATGPFDENNMFEGLIRIGTLASGRPLEVGRYIAGNYSGKDGWARPKPMWSWDDAWDEIPIFVVHFFPSHAFRSHLGVATSSQYVEHRAAERSFGLSPGELWKALDLPTEARDTKTKWENRNFHQVVHQVQRKHVYEAAKTLFKRYADYLFQALG